MWLVEKYSQGAAYNMLTRVLSSPDWLQGSGQRSGFFDDLHGVPGRLFEDL